MCPVVSRPLTPPADEPVLKDDDQPDNGDAASECGESRRDGIQSESDPDRDHDEWFDHRNHREQENEDVPEDAPPVSSSTPATSTNAITCDIVIPSSAIDRQRTEIEGLDTGGIYATGEDVNSGSDLNRSRTRCQRSSHDC